MAERKQAVTIKDVAKRAGVSIAAVSYVLNGKTGRCGPETLERIRAAVDDLGYEPDYAARSLVLGRSRIVGLVLPLTRHHDRSTSLLRDNPFYGEFYDGLTMVASEGGFDIIVTGLEDPAEAESWARRRGLDGLIFLGMAPSDGSPSLADLPVVLVDAARPLNRGEWPCVFTDDEAASRDAVSRLIALGHRDIAFVSGSRDGSLVNQARWQGYRQAILTAGIAGVPALAVEEPCSFEGGALAARRLLEGGIPFSAVFCAADVMAFGLIRALADEGLSVPGRISVMGFDDLSTCRHFVPLLSTVRQGIEEKGRRAMTVLVGLMAGESPERLDIPVPHEVVMRESTGEPR